VESTSIRVAYTLEQCWHAAPGGTAIAALRIARELRGDAALADEIDLHFVAGKHAAIPPEIFRPEGPVAMLPLARPLLYETWTRWNWPKVESVVGPIDVAHATGLIPCATSAPLVVTIHDLAFQGRELSRNTGRLLESYILVLLLYFLMAFPMTRVVKWLERRVRTDLHVGPIR